MIPQQHNEDMAEAAANAFEGAIRSLESMEEALRLQRQEQRADGVRMAIDELARRSH